MYDFIKKCTCLIKKKLWNRRKCMPVVDSGYALSEKAIGWASSG